MATDIVPNRESGQFKSGEQAVNAGRRGGIASGKAKRARKTFREIAEVLGAMRATGKAVDNVKKMFPQVKDKDITNDVAIVANNIFRAINGDAKASEWLVKIMGENIVKAEVTGKDGRDLFTNMTDDELEAKIKALEKQ